MGCDMSVSHLGACNCNHNKNVLCCRQTRMTLSPNSRKYYQHLKQLKKEHLHIGYIKRTMDADQINWAQFEEQDGSFKCPLCTKRAKTKNAVQQHFGRNHKDQKGIVLEMVKTSAGTSSEAGKLSHSLGQPEHQEEQNDDDTRMIAEVITKEVMFKCSATGLEEEVGPALQITVDVPGEGERSVKAKKGSTLARMVRTNVADPGSATTDERQGCEKFDHR